MFTRIIGYFWIFFGILWVLKPAWLRGWFARKANWKAFWFLLGMILFAAFSLWSSAAKIQIAFFRNAAFTVIAAFAVFAWILQSKARGKLGAWSQALPLLYFQIIGGVNAALGAWLVYSAR